MPKYSHVTVRLLSADANAFSLAARVSKALRRGGVSESIVEAFQAEATAGDYDHLLQTVANWVTVEEAR